VWCRLSNFAVSTNNLRVASRAGVLIVRSFEGFDQKPKCIFSVRNSVAIGSQLASYNLSEMPTVFIYNIWLSSIFFERISKGQEAGLDPDASRFHRFAGSRRGMSVGSVSKPEQRE
jgi:hypothetical protein